jgi:DNA-binding NarL/FixJ family response regulator
MRKYTLLIIENDEDEQFFMKEAFDATDAFDVIGQLGNGTAMLEWLKVNEGNFPDLVLSDLNMPGKNGYDVINDLKAVSDWAHIPVIITSTSSQRSTIDKCLSMGAAGFIPKPDTFTQYERYVHTLRKIVDDKQLVNK